MFPKNVVVREKFWRLARKIVERWIIRIRLGLSFQKLRSKNKQFENVILKNAVKRLTKSWVDLKLCVLKNSPPST